MDTLLHPSLNTQREKTSLNRRKQKSMSIHMKHHGLTVGSIISINVLTFGPPLELDNDMVWKNGYIITSLIKDTKRDNFIWSFSS